MSWICINNVHVWHNVSQQNLFYYLLNSKHRIWFCSVFFKIFASFPMMVVIQTFFHVLVIFSLSLNPRNHKSHSLNMKVDLLCLIHLQYIIHKIFNSHLGNKICWYPTVRKNYWCLKPSPLQKHILVIIRTWG